MSNRTPEREQFLADVITGAVEGGTGYWAVTLRYKWQGLPAADVHAVLCPQEDWDELQDGPAALRKTSTLLETGTAHVLNVDVIAKALGKIARGEVSMNATLLGTILAANARNDGGDIDSEAADVIAQVATLGSIVYG